MAFGDGGAGTRAYLFSVWTWPGDPPAIAASATRYEESQAGQSISDIFIFEPCLFERFFPLSQIKLAEKRPRRFGALLFLLFFCATSGFCLGTLQRREPSGSMSVFLRASGLSSGARRPTGSTMRLEDLILRSIARRCVSKDEAIEVEIALAHAWYHCHPHAERSAEPFRAYCRTIWNRDSALPWRNRAMRSTDNARRWISANRFCSKGRMVV